MRVGREVGLGTTWSQRMTLIPREKSVEMEKANPHLSHYIKSLLRLVLFSYMS